MTQIGVITMSKLHPYRVQLHCDRKMHQCINQFAEERGLSQSAAARLLIDRSMVQKNDEITDRLDKLEKHIESVLHASSVNRILSSDIAQKSGVQISNEELKERVAKLMQRYKR